MPPSCWPSPSWMACWSAGRRSIRAVGRNLCARRSPRYLAPRMYTVLVAILILDSLILTTAVLLQAWHGGGLAPTAGGARPATGVRGRQAAASLAQRQCATSADGLFL